MTKFVLARPDAPWDYPTLGFRADVNGAILDGSLFDTPLTVPPDGFWSVYGGGSAETGITRYSSGGGGTPTPETPDGYLLVYQDAENRGVFVNPTDLPLVIVRKADGTSLSGKVVVLTVTDDEADIDNIAVFDDISEVGA